MDAGVIRADRGFTLVELMVVIAVLSLLTLTVTLGVNRPRTALSQDWSRFSELHARLREQAVTGDSVLGLSLSPEGYARMHRDAGDWVEDGRRSEWRGPVEVQQPFDARQVVTFLPNGRATPVRLRFAGDGQNVTCESNGWEPLECAVR